MTCLRPKRSPRGPPASVPPAAAASSDDAPGRPIAASMLDRRALNAARPARWSPPASSSAAAAVPAAAVPAAAVPPAGVAPGTEVALAADSAVTALTMASYQDRITAGSVSARPSTSATTATASGPARLRRSSALPSARIPATRRPAVAPAKDSSRALASAPRNAWVNGSRWRRCAAPSSESIDGPTTRAVENRGSSTVNVSLSLITRNARSWRVTSQPPSTGSQETGSSCRSRRSSTCGLPSSSAIVAEAPSGNRLRLSPASLLPGEAMPGGPMPGGPMPGEAMPAGPRPGGPMPGAWCGGSRSGTAVAEDPWARRLPPRGHRLESLHALTIRTTADGTFATSPPVRLVCQGRIAEPGNALP